MGGSDTKYMVKLGSLHAKNKGHAQNAKSGINMVHGVTRSSAFLKGKDMILLGSQVMWIIV